MILKSLISSAFKATTDLVATAVNWKINERNIEFQQWRLQQEQELQRELTAYVQDRGVRSEEDNLAFQKWRFEKERKLQWDLALLDYHKGLETAAYQRQTALESIEFEKILANYPLKISPTQLLDSYKAYQESKAPIPLLILLSPPKLDFDQFEGITADFPPIEKHLAEGIRRFLSNYSEKDRPVKFLAGAWDTKRMNSETAVAILFWMFKSIPTLILESEIDGDYLNLRAAFWGLNFVAPHHKSIISRLPFREILSGYAKEDALNWRTQRDLLMAQGKAQSEIEVLGGIDEANLKVLERDETDRTQGLKRPYEYRITRSHFERFYGFLITCHCLVSGWVADIHHFTDIKTAPLLPKLLTGLSADAADREIIETMVSGYDEVYSLTATGMPHWMNDFHLELAEALANLQDKSWSLSEIELSIRLWLQVRVPPESQGKGVEQFHLMRSLLRSEDQSFVEKLEACLRAVGDADRAAQLRHILMYWREQKIKGGITRDENGDSLYDAWG